MQKYFVLRKMMDTTAEVGYQGKESLRVELGHAESFKGPQVHL